MKHIPNICTLANLFFGCIAITYILHAPFFYQEVGEEVYKVFGVEQLAMGSLFICLAAIMDVFDGFAARALKVNSLIGKDLDSLADVVSFGVAPSMILYKLLWSAYMAEPGALQTPIVVVMPAFLVACFGALRLAKFNQTSATQQNYFLGMPIPAVGLLVASLPLLAWYAPPAVSDLLLNRWALYAVTTLVCYLMVSKIKFLKWKASGKGNGAWWPQIGMVLALAIGAPFLKFAVIPAVFVLYILFSVVYKHPAVVVEERK